MIVRMKHVKRHFISNITHFIYTTDDQERRMRAINVLGLTSAKINKYAYMHS